MQKKEKISDIIYVPRAAGKYRVSWWLKLKCWFARLLFIVFFMPCVARAEIVPEGCYYVYAEEACYSLKDLQAYFLSPDKFSQETLINYYGDVVTLLLEAYWQQKKENVLLKKKIRKMRKGR